jgi:hypothetical protein
MTENLDFNREFGSKWYERIEKPILISTTLALIFVFSMVIYLARFDFSKYEEQHEIYIFEKYKRLVSELIINEDENAVPKENSTSALSIVTRLINPDRIVTSSERRVRRAGVEEQMSEAGIFNPENSGSGSDILPYIDDAGSEALFNDELMIELSRRSGYTRVHGRSGRRVTNMDPGEFDEPFTGLSNYVLKRQGNAYINLTPELLPKDEPEFGYRDPDEIQRVIARHRPMIEYCYRKGISHNAGMQGYVKIQFYISHSGEVIPESIKILNSTINDRQVEQCIKNYIKRWRNFEVLDESMGIARVTQKFIFN